MIDEKRTLQQRSTDETGAQTETVDKGRRAALLNIGALAGAAPAVAVLLTPSASRATGGGGSPCEEPCGSGDERGTAPGYTPGNTGAPGGNVGFLGTRDS